VTSKKNLNLLFKQKLENAKINQREQIAYSKDLVTLFSIEILRELNKTGYSIKYIKTDNVFRDDLLIGI
jgi:hypothetical protein